MNTQTNIQDTIGYYRSNLERDFEMYRSNGFSGFTFGAPSGEIAYRTDTYLAARGYNYQVTLTGTRHTLFRIQFD